MRKLPSFGESTGQAYPLTHLWRCLREGAGGKSGARPLICVAAVHGGRQSRPGCCLSIAFVSVPLRVVFPCGILMLSWAKSIISLGLVILTGGSCRGRQGSAVARRRGDRKSGEEGKGVAAREDTGGCR